MEPLLIPLIKVKYYGKSDTYFVNLKLRRDPMSSKSDLYEFKMSLFDNGELEYFLLFVRNFNINLVVTGMMETAAKIKYLRTLVCGEALHQFDSFSADVGSTETLNMEYIIKGLAF